MGIGAGDLVTGTPWWGGEGYGVGDSIEGLVVKASREQQRDFDTGTPMEWDNGDPRMESVVVIEFDPDLTDMKGDKLENDDGRRAIHLRGGNPEVAKGEGRIGEKALLEAINSSGLECDEGVHIKASITGMAKPTGRGRNPAKLWAIELSEPKGGISADELFDDD